MTFRLCEVYGYCLLVPGVIMWEREALRYECRVDEEQPYMANEISLSQNLLHPPSVPLP